MYHVKILKLKNYHKNHHCCNTEFRMQNSKVKIKEMNREERRGQEMGRSGGDLKKRRT